jgi:hypothetical protein
MRTVLVLVERSQSQSAYVAGGVVAWSNGVVGDGIGTDEADLGVVVVALGCRLQLGLEVGYLRAC